MPAHRWVAGALLSAAIGVQLLCPTLVPATLQEATGENPYAGRDADYAVSSLFSHDFKYTRYIGQVSRPPSAWAATPRCCALSLA